MKTLTRSLSIALVLALGLLSTACSPETPASPLVVALDAITIAADVVPATIPNLSTQATACISAIPDLVTVITGVIEGSQPLATAQTAVTGLETLLSTSCVASAVPAKDQALVTGIAKAISAFLKAYQALLGSPAASPTATSAIVTSAYVMGFVDTPKTATAKVKAPRADRKLAKTAAKRMKKLKAAFAKVKKGK